MILIPHLAACTRSASASASSNIAWSLRHALSAARECRDKNARAASAYDSATAATASSECTDSATTVLAPPAASLTMVALYVAAAASTISWQQNEDGVQNGQQNEED
jgi:hypothetical protein